MSKSPEHWAEQLQPDVAYCYNCQPRDGGEYIWVQGNRLDMIDLLSEHDVPEELWEAVADLLCCLHCGTELDLSCEIGRKTQEEVAFDDMRSNWHRLYKPKLEDFVQWLEKYPYLGMHHELGRQFIEEIPDFPKRSLPPGQTWYRARAVRGSGIPTMHEMGPPIQPPRSEGRFNHHGQIVFYLAADETTSAAESLGKARGIAWVQEYAVGPFENLLDLEGLYSPDDYASAPMLAAGVNWTQPHSEEAGDTEWKPQYFLPRFIADCARAVGFSGIVYRSTRFYGECLVLFNWEASAVTPAGDPKLLEWDADIAESEMPF